MLPSRPMPIHTEQHDDGVLLVTIDRQEVMNALDVGSKEALGRIWREAATDPAVRAVVLAGAGPKAFCAGSDTKEMQRTGRMVTTATLIDALPNVGCDIDKPVIAALHGYTIGFGFSLAIHCDFRFAARDTTLAFPEAAHGMISGVSAVTLPHLVGHGLAMDLMVSGRRVDAAEAARIGLANEVVDGDVLAHSLAFARRLASFPVASVAASKRLVVLELRHQVRKYRAEIDAARVAVAEALRLDARGRAG